MSSIGNQVFIYNRHAVKKEHQPEVATVTYIHKDGTINVGGYDMYGMPFAAHNVKLSDDQKVTTIRAGSTAANQNAPVAPATYPPQTAPVPAPAPLVPPGPAPGTFVGGSAR